MADDEDDGGHRVHKVRLKHLVSDVDCVERIQYAVETIHDISCSALSLGKLLYLSELDAAVEGNGGAFDASVATRMAKAFRVDAEQIEDWMNTVSGSLEGHVGRPYGADKAVRMAMLHAFYDAQAARGFLPSVKPSSTNLSYPKGHAASQLATNYGTNVHVNFDKYVRRFVDGQLRTAAKAALGLSHLRRLPREARREVMMDVRAVSRDLLEAPPTPTCREGLRSWLERSRPYLVPPRPASAADRHWRFSSQERQPHRWLPYMVWINRLLEDNGDKLLSPLPQKTGFVPGHIRIDTAGLIDMLVPGADRTSLLKAELEGMDMPALEGDVGPPVKYDLPGLHAAGKKKPVEGTEPKTSKTRLFADLAVLVSAKLVPRVKRDPVGHAAAFKTATWRCLTKLGANKHVPTVYHSGMVFSNVIDTDGVSVSVHYTSASLFGLTRFNGGFKKLKESQRAQVRSEKAKGAVYITDLSEDDRQALLHDDGKKVSADPGKGCIVCLTDGSGEVISYTSAQRRVESRAAAHAKKQQRMLDARPEGERTPRSLLSSIGRIQAAGIVSWSSKSTIPERYEHYLRTRLAVADELNTFYRRRTFRQMRYDAFVGRRASEDRFFSKAKKAFGDDAIILYGDWGRNPNLRHQPPSPGVAFRRRMCSHFRVLLVHEPYTSSVCPRCGTRGVAKPRLDRNGEEIHHLLRCENQCCPCPWWNRDVLGSLNIHTTGVHALRTGSWHPMFTMASGA